MAKKLKVLNSMCVKMVKTPALARKYECSDVYVRCVLTGKRDAKSKLARLILKDANDIVSIYERNTDSVTESKGYSIHKD